MVLNCKAGWWRCEWVIRGLKGGSIRGRLHPMHGIKLQRRVVGMWKGCYGLKLFVRGRLHSMHGSKLQCREMGL